MLPSWGAGITYVDHKNMTKTEELLIRQLEALYVYIAKDADVWPAIPVFEAVNMVSCMQVYVEKSILV